MDVIEHIEHLRRDGGLLADAASKAGGDAHVPTCPDWTVRDLLLHIGEVHRWAAANVSAPPGERADMEQLASAVALAPDDFVDLVAWFRDGRVALVDTLAAADPAGDCWHFLPAPSGTAFWARRQAHETAIHRVDAEGAVGPGASVTPFDAAFAVDGIDELLLGFMNRPGGRLKSDAPCSLCLRAADTGDAWTVRITSDGRVVTRDDNADDSDCTVSGPASDLYQFVWNRHPVDGLEVEGDRAVLDLWRERALITWGP